MSVLELIKSAQFMVDGAGNKKAVVLDMAMWEELLTLLEDLEDAQDLTELRQLDEEVTSWEQAKAELRADEIDV
jgi:hypothetical protein